MKHLKSFWHDLKAVASLIFVCLLFYLFIVFFIKGQQKSNKNEPIYTTLP